MIYNIHYDICAMGISIFSIAYILSKKGFRQMQNKILFALICVNLGAIIFDIISAIANSYVEDWSGAARYCFNYGYLILQNFMPYLLSCYVICILGLTYRLGKKQVARLLGMIAIPWVACVLLLFTNPFTKVVFYFDEENVYCHSFGIYILYGVAFLYLAYIFFLLIRYGHRAVRSKKYMIMSLATATTLAVIAQMFFPNILMQLGVEALCLLGLLVTVDNEAEIVDQITTCYNRQRFLRDSVLGLENKANFEVIVIKIPGLGSYNASIGIGEVNKIMRALGLWLRSIAKESEVYYCDDGCFTILCDRNTDSTTIEPLLAKRFQENFVVGKTAIRFRPIVSHVRAGKEFKNLEQLMLWIGGADQQTVNGASVGDSAVKITDYKKELIMQHAIERALQFDEFEVKYQPIWNAKSNMITDAEALVRLYDEADDLIPADSFISFAERRGYIFEIGECVFENVCRFIATHDLEKVGIERIHINLSPYQCMNEMLPENFEKIREKYNVPVEKLVLEISESGVMENFAMVEKTVNILHDKGYSFALDNYGKSSMDMKYLFQLPFSILKLDKNFLWKAESNVKANIFFSGTMRVAKEMGMKTVVLGVEIAAQKTLLLNYDCDYLQGFYYQKAIPAEQFYRYCVGFNSKE